MQTISLQSFRIADGGRLLDLGCGGGRHVLASCMEQNLEAVGLDMNPESLIAARAQETTLKTRSQPEWVCGDALRLPFPDHCFDGLICSEVLEHLTHYRAALIEIKRVLKPGGLLAISVPLRWTEAVCWRLCRDYYGTAGGHIRIFQEHKLRQEIEAQGFRCYHRHGAHALHTPYWWLQCLLWKRRERSRLVRGYHRFLVWEMMRQPRWLRRLEQWLNPWLGKSVALYFRRLV